MQASALIEKLPAHLQDVSKLLGDLATQLAEQLPDGPEKSAGMRKLLKAKNCFILAALNKAEPPSDVPADLEAYYSPFGNYWHLLPKVCA